MIDDIIKNIIRSEGGFVNDPDDLGGPTKYGITKPALCSHLGREVDICDIKDLTKKEAADIYEQNYFHYPRIDELPEQMHPIMLDMSVNHGHRRAIKILQQELAQNSYAVGKIDGIIGKKTSQTTLQAYNDFGDEWINLLIERRLTFYKNIIIRKPSQKKFWNGWMARAESFRPKNS